MFVSEHGSLGRGRVLGQDGVFGALLGGKLEYEKEDLFGEKAKVAAGKPRLVDVASP